MNSMRRSSRRSGWMLRSRTNMQQQRQAAQWSPRGSTGWRQRLQRSSKEGQALRGDGLRSYPPWAGRCCTLLRSAWLTPMSNRFSLQCRSGTWWRCASPMTECECWLLSTWTEAFEETSLRYEFGLGIRALTSGRRGGDGGGGGGGAGDGALLLLLLLLLLLPDTGFKSCQMHKPAAR